MRRPPERVMRGVWIASLFALAAAYVADQAGLEGIVSKRADSPYRSGPTTNWLKTKSFTVQEYELLGVEREPGKAAFALLAKPGTGKYAGSAFITLNQEMRERLWKRVQEHAGPPPKGKKRPATMGQAGLKAHVKHLRGEFGFRHASLQDSERSDTSSEHGTN
ncbi:hypothetical protein [Mesorhizobium sp. M0768]|uniref:hypothetical protein n=1 Tax=Mesorhizobium sp. M0768 TaxID=2956996 RepID=UPI003334EE24